MTKNALPLFAAALLISGCTAHTDGPHAKTYPEDARGTACVPAGTWFDPAAGSHVEAAQVIPRLADKDLVLLGETHTIADHHRWQLQVIAQLYAQRPDMMLGFESFPRRVQDVLDLWVAGELTEKEFLDQSDWETVWTYDSNLYMPLFHFARMNAIPMVALNVDSELTGEISKTGWKAVPEDKRRGLGDPARPPQAYLDMLAAVYGRHDHTKDAENSDGENDAKDDEPQFPTLDDPRFSNFVDVQLTWDRAMAEAAVTALKSARKEGRDPRMVAIVGRGHMDHFFGIPVQLDDLGETNFAVVTPWDRLRRCDGLIAEHGAPAADLVFGIEHTRDIHPPEKPKLGVMIHAVEGGINVGKVLEDSIAENAGIRQGDLIVEAAGQTMIHTGDLVTVIKSMGPGTWLPLKIKRGEETLEIIARFPVDPPRPPSPHKVHGEKP